MKPSLDELIDRVVKKAKPENTGMVLTHLGLVRGTSKSGKRVVGMKLSYDREKLKSTVEEIEKKKGIEAVEVWINSGELKVGDPIMAVAIAGRFRTDVLPAFEELIEKIKKDVVVEEEINASN